MNLDVVDAVRMRGKNGDVIARGGDVPVNQQLCSRLFRMLSNGLQQPRLQTDVHFDRPDVRLQNAEGEFHADIIPDFAVRQRRTTLAATNVVIELKSSCSRRP